MIHRLVHAIVLSILMVASGVGGAEPPKRPVKIWNLTGPLGETPKHVTDAYPLSDQQNRGGWVKFEPMSDEFEGKELDRNKWVVGMDWWKGRPACPVQRQERHGVGRQAAPDHAEGETAARGREAGLQDYTSAALHTKARTAYGYFEVKAKPMNSAGSSSFWFQVEDTPGWLTEIDVFEIGGKAKGFERKYNMNLHVFKTPQEKRHWECAAHLGGSLATGRRLPRLWPGMGQGRDQVFRRWRRGPHGGKHALAPAALPDFRQRDDARVVWNAEGRRLAIHVQHRVRAGVEKGGTVNQRGSSMKRITTAIIIVALATGVARGQPVVVTPEETDEILANPGMGWETFHRTSKQDKTLPSWIPSTVHYARWGWGELEPQPGKLNTEFLDKVLKETHESGQKLAFRVMCCSTSLNRPYPISKVQIVH